jgi:phytoene dehydrogenase-like protein
MSDGSLAPEGQHVVSVLVRPVPQNPKEDWQSLKPRLVEHAVQALERMAPGVAAMIVAAKVFTPDDLSEPSSRQGACHILAGYETRIKSSQRGLLFCGMDVEPVFEISGRAARIAARLAVRK